MSCSCTSGRHKRWRSCPPKQPVLSLCESIKQLESKQRRKDPSDCKEETCGLLPRRIPILGTDDPLWEKCQRAFQMQAEQGIWDIGEPSSSRREMTFRKSRFRVRYERGHYPFHLDHSGDVSTKKISWTVDIEQYDITSLLKDTLEAQSDNPHWAQVGRLAFMDMLKHLSPVKLAAALPSFSVEFRNMMRRNNEETARRLLKMLKELALVVTSIGPELAFYAHDLFNLCYQWLMRGGEVGDRIVYEQKKATHLNDLTDELHAIFEVVSGAEQDYAVAGMKLAIPTYRVPEKTQNTPQANSGLSDLGERASARLIRRFEEKIDRQPTLKECFVWRREIEKRNQPISIKEVLHARARALSENVWLEHSKGLHFSAFHTSDMNVQKIKIDCNNDVLNTAIDAAKAALQRVDSNKSRASYVRNAMDDRYGQAWSCIVGKDFGSELPYLPNQFAFFTIDETSFLVCKTSENVQVSR